MEAKRVFRTFKLQGLSIRSDALKFLVEQLKTEPGLSLEDVIYAVKNNVDKAQMTASVVSVQVIERALDTLLAVTEENQYEELQIFDAFDTPRLNFMPMKNCYEMSADVSRMALHASPSQKIQLFRERFSMIQQRIKRNRLFSPPLISTTSAEQEDYIKLTNIESLLGTTGQKRIVGMLGQDERKRLFLEDLTSRIFIDTCRTNLMVGLFIENSIVLAEGEVVDDVFHVESLGFPPPESRLDSLEAIGGIDPMGIEISKKQLEQIQEMERNDDQSAFIILSDVHLDNAHVMKSLESLFEGFEAFPPPVFILIGNFTSKPVSEGSYTISDFKHYLDEFGVLVRKFPSIMKSSKIILVPGPEDPGAPRALPRTRLPDICTQSLLSRVPNVVLASNPCRIRYYTKDIVILREDLVQKARRHAILPISSDEGEVDISEHLAKTVVDQGHLCPLPLSARPVHWAYDYTLQLFPVPNVIVLADSYEQYQWGYTDTAVLNPGPFHVDSSFILFRPSTNTTEFSRVHD